MGDAVSHVVLLVQARALTGPYLSAEGRGAPEDRWQNNVNPAPRSLKRQTVPPTAHPLTDDMNRDHVQYMSGRISCVYVFLCVL